MDIAYNIYIVITVIFIGGFVAFGLGYLLLFFLYPGVKRDITIVKKRFTERRVIDSQTGSDGYEVRCTADCLIEKTGKNRTLSLMHIGSGALKEGKHYTVLIKLGHIEKIYGKDKKNG